MALQTREQHIRREKATSNICTAQVLLSVMAGMYSVYHGPEGMKKISGRIHGLAKMLESGVKELGLKQVNEHYFDTLKIAVEDINSVEREAVNHEMNFRYFPDGFVGISLDETTSSDDVNKVLFVLASALNKTTVTGRSEGKGISWPASLIRSSAFLTHPVFNQHHSDQEA